MPSYFAVLWHITDNCDLRCQHCYIYASKKVKPVETPWEDSQNRVTLFRWILTKVQKAKTAQRT